MKKVLLYSGGMDSWLIDKVWKPDVKVFIDIGTADSNEAKKHLPDDVKIVKCELAEFEDKEKNYILPLRNLIFVELASYFGDEICIGATKDDAIHLDKQPYFAQKASELMNYLYNEAYDRNVSIVLPFLNTTKAELLKMFVAQGGTLDEAWKNTYSCYNPGEHGEPCFECYSCKNVINAFLECGYDVRQHERIWK